MGAAEKITSGSFPNGLPAIGSEADVRARRALMESSMRAEGTPEPMIARLATDDTAAKMLAYERQTLDLIASLFGPR